MNIEIHTCIDVLRLGRLTNFLINNDFPSNQSLQSVKLYRFSMRLEPVCRKCRKLMEQCCCNPYIFLNDRKAD
jgi:hypothetical protein